jgi:hypothetical protein
MAEILGRVERLSTSDGGSKQQHLGGQAQVNIEYNITELYLTFWLI